MDSSVDDVTRHLLRARNKIEAVELEFAHIMGELAAYSERIPSAKAAICSPATAGKPSSELSDAAGRRALAEYFFVGTPQATGTKMLNPEVTRP